MFAVTLWNVNIQACIAFRFSIYKGCQWKNCKRATKESIIYQKGMRDWAPSQIKKRFRPPPSARALFRSTALFKVPLRRKIVDPIWNASEQHFQTSLNGVFSFSISFSVLEIFRFFKTCKLGVSDVIYSRIINYIYKIVNISVNNKQNSLKLSMSIAIW